MRVKPTGTVESDEYLDIDVSRYGNIITIDQGESTIELLAEDLHTLISLLEQANER